MKNIFIVALLFLAMTLPAAPVKIAVKGEAAGYIATEVDAPRPVKLAARELQNYLRKITTARYPVQHNWNIPGKTIFVLGTKDSTPVRESLNSADIKTLDKLKYDGYAVFRRANKIIIAGNNPRGVLNGVHRFIYKHTDFIWVRPYKELSNCTVDPDLTLDVKDYIDNPEFRMRGWGANGNIAIKSDEYFVFVSRLCNNWSPGSSTANLSGRTMDHGFIIEFGGGHNMSSRWLPKNKYGKSNPDFYMLLDGKRRTEGRVQLCYSNQEMIKVFIKETLEIAKKLPSNTSTINIMIDDTQAYCECKNCVAPIKLPDGRVLTRKDSSYKSTLFFMFLNQVARAVAKECPSLDIKCFGYFFTAIPPEIPVEKNIRISFCPYVRNDKETLFGKSNQRWLERTRKYAAMSPGIIWREYYFSGAGFPRPQANIIAKDLRYINTLGIRMIYSELSWADRPISAHRKRPLNEHDFFNITGAEFWVINQLFWDPRQDPDQLRDEYIRRTYREAAPAVRKFYKAISESWLNDPRGSHYNSDFRRDMGDYIVNKNLTKPLRAALAEAAAQFKSSRSKPQSMQLSATPVSEVSPSCQSSAEQQLKQLSGTFESWLKLASAGKVSEKSIPRAEITEFPNFDFDSGVWANAGQLPRFSKMNQPMLEPQEPTDVKLLHNGRTLYIAFRCPAPGKLQGNKNSARDVWPSGDRVEIFFGKGEDNYYHFAFNCFAANMKGCYDAEKTDSKWNPDWEVRTQVKEGEWRAVVAIPLKSVGVVIEQNNKIRTGFFRTRPGRGGKDTTVHSGWGGAVPHNIKQFGELVLLHE